MNAQTAAADFLVSRAFFQSPAMATMHEDAVGELIRASRKEDLPKTLTPASPKATARKYTSKITDEFVAYVKANPDESHRKIGARFGITVSCVAGRIKQLRQQGKLPKAGPPLYVRKRPEVLRLRELGLTRNAIVGRLGISESTYERAMGNLV